MNMICIEELVVDIWMGMKEYFDKKQYESIASKFLDILVDDNVPDEVLRLCLGQDEDLDAAIVYYLDDVAEDDGLTEFDIADNDYEED